MDQAESHETSPDNSQITFSILSHLSDQTENGREEPLASVPGLIRADADRILESMDGQGFIEVQVYDTDASSLTPYFSPSAGGSTYSWARLVEWARACSSHGATNPEWQGPEPTFDPLRDNIDDLSVDEREAMIGWFHCMMGPRLRITEGGRNALARWQAGLRVTVPEPNVPTAPAPGSTRRQQRDVPKNIEMLGKAAAIVNAIDKEMVELTGRTLSDILDSVGVSHEVFNRSQHFTEARARLPDGCS